MQPVGFSTLAKWREAGEWWKGEPDREVHRFVDDQGRWSEVTTPLAQPPAPPKSQVKVRVIRDEKVSLATGYARAPRFGTPQNGNGVLLHALSAYSLGGTMLASEIPAIAAEKGYRAVCLADRFSLTGAMEFARTAKQVGIQPMIGITVELAEGGDIVLVAKNQVGYRSLSRLVTECHLNEPKGYPLATWDRLARHSEGLVCLTGGSHGLLDLHLIKRDHVTAHAKLSRLIQLYGSSNVFVQIEMSHLPWQTAVSKSLRDLASAAGVRCISGGPILMDDPSHFPAHDALVCIDSLCLIDEIEGRKPFRDASQPQLSSLPRRSLNRERYIRLSVDATSSGSADHEQLLADMCDQEVLPGRTELPPFCQDEDAALRQITENGAWLRYGHIDRKLKARLDRELDRLVKLGWSRHFLIAWEMCEWARSQEILFSGRGSVVDSVVAYCLGISRIDAHAFDLHFDRFLPPDGSKRPDIDIDFEAARREDVRQHLVRRYGDQHVATVAAIGTYRTRGIIREVGKVMGIPEAHLAYLSKRIHGSVAPEKLIAALNDRPELRDSSIPNEKYHWVFEFAERLADLPRNLRAHSSGVVISRTPISDTVPVQQSGADGVKIMQWDKRSAKHCFDKFDVLCLRGNDVLGGTMRRVEGLDVCDIPLDDEDVYRTMRAGHLVGIPQSASPAMRQAHIRIGSRNLKDAGIVQAGIRPGVGGAVKLNEFVARRRGKPFILIHPDLESILGPTLGIVVFQEQIDQLLEKFGGYSGDEAEAIREAIQKNHERGNEGQASEEMRAKITANGYSHAVAEEVTALVSGFKGYGFAEGHALSFAEISIRSIYCQQNHPASYFAALLDAQPAGYYGPTTLANEARSRGVKVLPPDVNLSERCFAVEHVKSDSDPTIILPDSGVRVPLRQIAGLSDGTLRAAHERRPYGSFFDFVNRVSPARDELESLILAGAFDALTPHRRGLLWVAKHALAQSRVEPGACLPLAFHDPPIPTDMPDFKQIEKAIAERRLMGLDIAHHLMAFERSRVASKGGLTAIEASQLMSDEPVFVVGNPIRLRFPPTQSGRRVMFFDLEDETGLLNVTCFDDVYQRDGHKVICHPFVTVMGTAQNRDGHIAFLAKQIFAYQPRAEEFNQVTDLPITVSDFLMS